MIKYYVKKLLVPLNTTMDLNNVMRDFGVKSTLKSNLPAAYYFQSFSVGWRRCMLLHNNSLSLPPLQMADGDFICPWRNTQVSSDTRAQSFGPLP
jgi:hypothetical protein